MMGNGYDKIFSAASASRCQGTAGRPAGIHKRGSDDPQGLRDLEEDTEVFMFYFQQGTQQQFYAAKELKRGAWR